MAEHTRTLDFKIAFAIGLGTMIAAGIFSLSGAAVAMIGSRAVIAFVIAAVIAGSRRPATPSSPPFTRRTAAGTCSTRGRSRIDDC
jgi:hypothetical protein